MSSDSVLDVVKLLIKYLFEGFIVALVAYIIPRQKLSLAETATIALTASSSFALLDLFMPKSAESMRSGLGFVLGSNLTGGVKLFG